MSQFSVNSLLAAIQSQFPGIVQPSAQPQGLVPGKAAGQAKDEFIQGQYWKNMATGRGEAAGSPGFSVYTRSAAAGKITEPRGGDPAELESGAQADEKSQGLGGQENGQADEAAAANPTAPTKPSGELLSQSEKAVLEQLQKADQAVRAHEMAHLAAAGGLAKGGASYTYRRGPDGNNYAVGGEVQIDMGREASPDATIEKMRAVRKAALAPADPSPQDQKIAAQATIAIAEAQGELQLSGSAGGLEPAGALADVPEDENTPARQAYREAGLALTGQNNQQQAGPRAIQAYRQAPVFPQQAGPSALELVA